MAVDPLEKFRKKPTETAGAPIVGAGEYEAFKAVDRRQYRLKIRPSMRAWERVPYAYLHRIVEDGAFGTELCLIYAFMVVVIKGRNLHLVADAIDEERCEYVQQYDPDKWAKPTDASAAFIESIDIHVETRVEAADESLTDITAAGNARH